jgi:hypothetical protein
MHDSEKNGMESSSFNMSGAIRALWSSPQCWNKAHQWIANGRNKPQGHK